MIDSVLSSGSLMAYVMRSRACQVRYDTSYESSGTRFHQLHRSRNSGSVLQSFSRKLYCRTVVPPLWCNANNAQVVSCLLVGCSPSPSCSSVLHSMLHANCTSCSMISMIALIPIHRAHNLHTLNPPTTYHYHLHTCTQSCALPCRKQLPLTFSSTRINVTIVTITTRVIHLNGTPSSIKPSKVRLAPLLSRPRKDLRFWPKSTHI